jgi:hypothetical protein
LKRRDLLKHAWIDPDFGGVAETVSRPGLPSTLDDAGSAGFDPSPCRVPRCTASSGSMDMLVRTV